MVQGHNFFGTQFRDQYHFILRAKVIFVMLFDTNSHALKNDGKLR